MHTEAVGSGVGRPARAGAGGDGGERVGGIDGR